MKEIKFLLSDSQYEQLERFVSWANLNNIVKNKDKPHNFTVEEIAKGIILSHPIYHFKELDPLSEYNVVGNFEIKNRFKEIATKKGITVKGIANQLGVSPPSISNIWNNHSQPRMELFIKIWILLGCPEMHECLYVV